MTPSSAGPAHRRDGRVTEPHNIQAPDVSLEPLFDGQADYLIRMIRIRELRAIDVLLEPFDVTLSAWYPLAVLRELDGMSQRELGRRLSLKDAAIGKAVDALVRSGLVQRRVGIDRRKILVFLTDSGREVADEVATQRRRLLDILLRDFSGEEARRFADYLRRAYTNVDAFVAEQDG